MMNIKTEAELIKYWENYQTSTLISRAEMQDFMLFYSVLEQAHHTVAAERQAAALERIAAVLESMTSKGNEYLSVGVMK